MNTYEVTIAIPIYNAEKYIRTTLDSALAQSFESIEFLMLDDCGTDSSIGIVHEYQQNHPRGNDIRIVRQSQNMGVGHARNRIIDEAQGKFLYFMDADDTIEPNTIDLMWQAAQTYQAQVVLTSYERVETYHEQPVTEEYLFPFKVFLEDNSFAEYAFHRYGALLASVCNMLMNIDFVRTWRLRFVDTNFWEDMAFKYEMATYVSRAVLLPDITYHYICRENSLSHFQNRAEVPKSEVFRNILTIDTLKQNYYRLIRKPYFANWLNFVLKTDFYIICNILKKGNRIQPSFSNGEIQNILYSPLSISQTWKYGNIQTFFYKFLTIIPSALMVLIIKMLGKLKGLI